MVQVRGVFFVLAVCASVTSGLSGPDGGPTTASLAVDLSLAKSAQQRHLEALFNRYGENGSITLLGLKQLLQNIGLDRVRNVTVLHTEHPGHHEDHQGHDHHHPHNHYHHHHHHDSLGSKVLEVPSQRETPDHQRTVTPGPAAVAGLVLDTTHTSGDDHSHHSDHGLVEVAHPCQNASTILLAHGLSQEASVTVQDFAFLCPALLSQIDGGGCIQHGTPHHHDEGHHHHHHDHGHDHDHGHGDTEEPNLVAGKSMKAAWIRGFVSISIISLLSLLSVVLIQIMDRVFFQFLLSILVALAVGALSGDALLHLLPHSQGNHQHLQKDSSSWDHLDSVWKGLTALSGVYLMFLIEHFLTLAKIYKDRKQKKKDQVDPEKQMALMDQNLKPTEDVETNGAGALVGASKGLQECGVAEEEQVMLAPTTSYTAEDCENKCHSHLHDTVGTADSEHHHHHNYHHILHHHHSQNHHPHSHAHPYSQQHFQEAGVATLVWMVIMGDGLHNFSDGLAIGAAFTRGLSGGLSTSVAVFCRELPHKLGDFAVLLKAGMTVRQAVLYNFLSAIMAFLGLLVGLLIGQYAECVCMWVFALTAGLFLYVSLVDMVPEMLHNGDSGSGHCGFFLLQNVGILLGFTIVLLFAVFEHQIE
ncbi:zinc transporter ZIP6 isoform 1-T1 [Synchiropus picturatus]